MRTQKASPFDAKLSQGRVRNENQSEMRVMHSEGH